MNKYKLPECGECGSIVDIFVEVKTHELKWKLDKDGTWGNNLLRDDDLDTVEVHLKCSGCGLTYHCEEDEYGRIYIYGDLE